MKFFLILAFCLSLYAGHGEKREHHINKDLTYLELSQAQIENFKEVLKKFQHEMEEFREFKEAITAKKKALFLKEPLDTNALNALNQALYEKASKEENKILLRIHNILSPEQRGAFVQYFEEWEVR
ncbi:MAG: Spy/CpxP family protein refolding chaperone [Sulfurospirillaceae bacterium]|nr:Spy/CpxP family protein refolding chaperone [Sulfurospirillaceae bacterium]